MTQGLPSVPADKVFSNIKLECVILLKVIYLNHIDKIYKCTKCLNK